MNNEENKLHPHYFPPKKGEKVMFSDWPVWKKPEQKHEQNKDN